jgi:tetratricopeptide (TPR) repeat protein
MVTTRSESDEPPAGVTADPTVDGGLAPARSELVSKARSLIDEGRYEEALEASDAAVTAAPDDVEAWLAKVDALVPLNRADDALHVLGAALEEIGPQPSLLLNTGRLLLDKEEFARGTDILKQFTELCPDDPRGWFGKGLGLLGLDRREDALACAEKAIELAADWERGYALLGDCLSGLERWDQAFEAYIQAAALDPVQFDASAWLRVGDRFLAKREDLALASYERAIAQDGESPRGWYGKGLALRAASRHEDALACAEKVLELAPDKARAFEFFGDCLLGLTRWVQAFEAFTRAAALDPALFDASSWASRGDRFFEATQQELALSSYECAIALDAENPLGWYGKGLVLEAREDLGGALAAYERASASDSRFIIGFLGAGDVCMMRNDYERALKFFGQAKEAAPEDPRPWRGIAAAHQERGELREALSAYEQAASIDPAHSATWNTIGNIRGSLDQLDEALRSYDRAIAADPNSAWPHNNRSYVFWRQRRLDEAVEAADKAISLDPDCGDFWAQKLLALAEMDVPEPLVEDYAGRALATKPSIGVQISIASFLVDKDKHDRARQLLEKINHSDVEFDIDRAALTETLFKLGDTGAAADMLRSIDPTKLDRPQAAVLTFLFLLAKKLERTTEGVEETFQKFLDQLGMLAEPLAISWGFFGLRALVARAELPPLDGFLLATLIDVLDGRVHRDKLSFFSAATAREKHRSATVVPQVEASGAPA